MQAAKRMKRFTLVALAVGLALILLVGSALAFAPVFVSLLSGDLMGARSFNDDVLTRYFTISGTPSYQRSVPRWTDVKDFTLDSEYQFDTPFSSLPGQPNTRYLWSDQWSVSVPYRFRLSAGSFIDVQTPVFYLSSDYDTLSVSGSGEFKLCFGNPVTTYPAQRVALLVNGSVVAGTESTLNAYGGFSLPVVSLDLSTYGNIESLGYRFYYDTGDYVLSGQGTGTGAYVYLYYNDTGFVVPGDEKEPEYKSQLDFIIGYLQNISANSTGTVSLLTQILDALGSMTNVTQIMDAVQTIITPTGVDQDAADQFDQQIQDKITEADQIQDTLDSLEKPEPTEIVPEISDYVSDADLQSFTGTLTVIFDNSAVVSMMMISLSLALVAYVLFGKR